MGLSAVAIVGSMEAVCGLFFIIGLGYLIAKVGWLSQNTKKDLGQLLISVFIPALIFTSMSKFPFETGGGVAAGPVCVFALIHTILGLILGVIALWVGRAPRDFRKLVLAMCTYGNAGNLPVAVVQTLAINGLGDGNVSNAVAFASLYYSIRQVIMWTTWRLFIARTDARLLDSETRGDAATSTAETDTKELQPAVVSDATPHDGGQPSGSCVGEAQTQAGPAAESALSSPALESVEPTPPPALAPAARSRCVTLRGRLTAWIVVSRYMPILAAVLGLIVASIDVIEDAFTLEGGSVHFVYDSMHMVGSVSSPAILLLLGASLWQPVSADRSRLPRRTLIAVIVMRLVLLPLLSLGLVAAMWQPDGGFLQGDRTLAMVLLVHGTMPTAMNVNIIVQESAFGEAELGHAMAMQYFSFLGAIPLWLVLYSGVGLI